MEYNRKFLGKKTKLHSIPTSQISISPKMFRFGKKFLEYLFPISMSKGGNLFKDFFQNDSEMMKKLVFEDD